MNTPIYYVVDGFTPWAFIVAVAMAWVSGIGVGMAATALAYWRQLSHPRSDS